MRVSKLFKDQKILNNHVVSKICEYSYECILNSVLFIKSQNIEYINEAIKLGCKTIVSEKVISVSEDVNLIIVKNVSKSLSKALYEFNKKIIEKFKVIMVTGTNGKTSTTTYLYNYLRLLEKKVLLVGSNGIMMDGLVFPTNNTTPSISMIYNYVSKFYQNNKILNKLSNELYLIIECSSQGIRGGRVRGIKADVILFTNITKDHLDFHKNESDYVFSKALLFHNLKKNSLVFINKENCYYDLLESICPNDVISYGVQSDISYNIIGCNLSGSIFMLDDELYQTKVIGDYQIENITAAYAILKSLKINLNRFKEYILNLTNVDGRFNYYNINNRHIIIDHGHTYNACVRTIEFIKKNVSRNINLVIGCGGNRDRSKRSLIGEYVVKNTKHVVFTEDNNRDESFKDIIKDITSKIIGERYLVIENRYEAIKFIIETSRENDYILIMGKGIEKTNVLGTMYTDYEMVDKIIHD